MKVVCNLRGSGVAQAGGFFNLKALKWLKIDKMLTLTMPIYTATFPQKLFSTGGAPLPLCRVAYAREYTDTENAIFVYT